MFQKDWVIKGDLDECKTTRASVALENDEEEVLHFSEHKKSEH